MTMHPVPPARRGALWPLAAIMIGSAVWGVIWYPLRILAGLGVSATAAGALTGLAACVFMALFIRGGLLKIPLHPLVFVLAVAAGVTNVGFTWGVIHGEVMRVLLLFYLSPAWTALLAYGLLHERLTRSALLLTALSLAGAGLMLWTPATGLPLPNNAAEWCGLIAGMGFAMNNVLTLRISRTLPGVTPQIRTFLVFAGSAVLGFVTMHFDKTAAVPLHTLALSTPHLTLAIELVVGMGVALALNNLLIQHGLVHVAANRASLVMLFEIVVTALSSWLLADEVPGAREWLGGGCIVLSAVLASWFHRENSSASGSQEPPAKRAVV